MQYEWLVAALILGNFIVHALCATDDNSEDWQ